MAGMARMVSLVWTWPDWPYLGEVCGWEEAAGDWCGCLSIRKKTVLVRITH